MAVRCTGEAALLEQLGEKQDFECLLTALGFRHEDLALSVRRVTRRSLGDARAYAVSVMRAGCGVRHVYLGGPAHAWIERFAAAATDVACMSGGGRRIARQGSGFELRVK